MNQTTNTVAVVKSAIISQDAADQITSAFKAMHHALLNHIVTNKLQAPTFNQDFAKCGPEDYKAIGVMARGCLTSKVEADKLARLLPFKAAIAKATETYMASARAAWEQVLALPAETRETLGLKAPVSVKVPVSAFSATWSSATDMARDLNEMKVAVVKGEKGDYINVPFVPATTSEQKKAA
jgi:hypothetical protein